MVIRLEKLASPRVTLASNGAGLVVDELLRLGFDGALVASSVALDVFVVTAEGKREIGWARIWAVNLTLSFLITVSVDVLLPKRFFVLQASLLPLLGAEEKKQALLQRPAAHAFEPLSPQRSRGPRC